MDSRALEKILIIKPSSLGDVIHALPVAAAVKSSFPGVKLDWVVSAPYVELLDGNPDIDRVIAFERGMLKGPGRLGRLIDFIGMLRASRYDAVVDLQGLLRSALMALACRGGRRIGFANAREGAPVFYTDKVSVPRPGMHAVERYLLVLPLLGIEGFDPSDAKFRITTGPDGDVQAAGLLAGAGIGEGEPFVAMAPSARWATKRWDALKFARLAGMLMERRGIKTVFVGSAGDAGLFEGVEGPDADTALFGKTSLKGLAAILKRAKLLITNDSGPMHISAAVGTPALAIFGPTDPSMTGPYGMAHGVITSGADCAPCFKRECENMACLGAIGVEEVYEAAAARLQ